ncbi:MAG: Bro-N domain-containing protein [Nanoarchaeota archaeon]
MPEEEKEITHIAIFNGKSIRRKFVNDKWFFSVVDIVGVLTDSEDPRKYWNKLSQRLREEGSEVVTFCHQLKLKAGDGKEYETDCADTEGIFRIIQSIPSKKAEPFKRWLAKVGYERVQEIENPELAQERMKKLYELKGYSKEWIEKRLRGITIRQTLTEEWKNRGIEQETDFAILTAEISKATFGMTPAEYKRLKKLKNENLRDHMNDIELIFNMLGEASTAEIEKAQDPNTFEEHLEISNKGGNVAKIARIKLEQETGKSVVTDENYLDEPEKLKKRRKKLLENSPIV